MQSPFDSKNPLASALDRIALRGAMLAASVLYFFFLWRSGLYSLLAGGGLFALLLLTLSLIERRTLRLREQMLRQRIGGAIYLESLTLMPASQACASVLTLLCHALDARALGDAQMEYEGETWLVRCAQCVPGGSTGAGDVLGAHRARMESGAQRCVIASTAAFTADAIRTAEWVDPPVRLIAGRQLASIAGRLHPATDADIAAHAHRRKTPYTRARILALAFSGVKTRRYLSCAFLLMVLYLFSGSKAALVFMLVSFVLAIFCHRHNRQNFKL